MWTLPKFRARDRVAVRSKEEILASLDENGALDGMPFMPEMFQHCGRELTVGAVAHKTCDTAMRTRGRKIDRTVHLEGVRCDGRAHGGCDAECLIFWKEEWLRPAAGEGGFAGAADGAITSTGDGNRRALTPELRCTEARVAQLACAGNSGGSVAGLPRYRCQATELFAASRPLPWWNLWQFFLDVATGNERLGDVIRVLLLNGIYRMRLLPAGYGVWCAIYEGVHRAITGRAGPFVIGKIKLGQPTPVKTCDLRAGEVVRIKPAVEIASTLNERNNNRGMWFGPEAVPYCGGTFRVRKRINRILNERTGEMLELKTPCVSLDNVTCRGHYSDARFFCPRQIMPYWREIWLERAGPAADGH